MNLKEIWGASAKDRSESLSCGDYSLCEDRMNRHEPHAWPILILLINKLLYIIYALKDLSEFMTEVKTCENNITEFLGIKHKKCATAWHKHGTWPRTKRDSCTRNWSLPEIRKANSSKALQSPSSSKPPTVSYFCFCYFCCFYHLLSTFSSWFRGNKKAIPRTSQHKASSAPSHRYPLCCTLVPSCSQLKVRVRATDPQTETQIPHGCARMMCIFVRSCY